MTAAGPLAVMTAAPGDDPARPAPAVALARDPAATVPAAAALVGALGGVCLALATRQAFNNPQRVPLRSSAVLAFDGAALGLLAGLMLARLARARSGFGHRLAAGLCVLLCAGTVAVAGWLVRDPKADATRAMSMAAAASWGVMAGVFARAVWGHDLAPACAMTSPPVPLSGAERG